MIKKILHFHATLLEDFGVVIADGDSGIIISSQLRYRLGNLPKEISVAFATTSTEKLLCLTSIVAKNH